MSERIKILIADDHAIVRIGLTALLNTERDFSVIGSAKDGESAVSETLRLEPDVVIMDILMPKKDGAAATAEILKKRPSTKIIILTSFGTSDGIVQALRSGASGAIMKTAEDSSLISAIRKIAAGGTYISQEIQQFASENPPTPELTKRQSEVLASMTRGLTNVDIARQFGICKDRVKNHVNAIMLKLGAANRTEAVAIALRKHLLKI